MAGGAACTVSCRSGILAKSSCSATPMAKARTTSFPSLAPSKDKKNTVDRKRGKKKNADAQRRQGIEHEEEGEIILGWQKEERKFERGSGTKYQNQRKQTERSKQQKTQHNQTPLQQAI